MKLISIITPCYNEEKNIYNCYKEIKSIFSKYKGIYNYEHIICDNNSTDQTFKILKEIAFKDKNIKLIRNSRNYGVFKNNFNGVMAAKGDGVILLIPADLQDPPELIPKFLEYWESGYQIVYGIRKKREEFFFLVILRKIYYRFLSSIANINYPADAGDFQLVDKVVIDAIKKSYIADPFMRMSTFDTGFDAIGIPYTWRKRKLGKSNNNFFQMIIQGLDGITSFSNMPIRATILIGLIVSLISFLYVFIVFILVFMGLLPKGEQGTLTLIAGIFLLNGIQIFSIGVVGEYVVRVLNQVRGKPHVIERERINF